MNFKTLSDLNLHMRKCTSCPLHENKKNGIVRGSGPRRARIAMVMDKIPLRDQFQSAVMVDSEEYEFVKVVFEMLGSNIDSVYFTPVTMCPKPKEKPPSAAEVKACRNRLHNELHIVQPELVIACGKEAITALIPSPKEKVSLHYHSGAVRQAILPGGLTPYEVPVMITHSLTELVRSNLVHEGSVIVDFRKHLKNALNLIKQTREINGK